MQEIWKPIKSFKGIRENTYEVSNLGNIRSKYRTLKQQKRKGYNTITLKREDGTRIVNFVHIIVANMFLEKEQGKDTVDHINFIRTDNRVVNLRWLSRSENGTKTRKKSNIGLQRIHKTTLGAYKVSYSNQLIGMKVNAEFGKLDEAKNFCERNGISYNKLENDTNNIYQEVFTKNENIPVKYTDKTRHFFIRATFATQKQADKFCEINKIENGINIINTKNGIEKFKNEVQYLIKIDNKIYGWRSYKELAEEFGIDMTDKRKHIRAVRTEIIKRDKIKLSVNMEKKRYGI